MIKPKRMTLPDYQTISSSTTTRHAKKPQHRLVLTRNNTPLGYNSMKGSKSVQNLISKQIPSGGMKASNSGKNLLMRDFHNGLVSSITRTSEQPESTSASDPQLSYLRQRLKK